MVKENPIVSIITPAYNAERFIGETIESVLEQTYTNWEMIIVDDASTDQTAKIVQDYMKKDARIRFIQLNKNEGSAVARNTAMREAKGQYLAFLDSDDLWFEHKLEKQLRFMQENEIAFSFTKYVRMKEDGKVTKAIVDAPKVVDYEELMKQCVIGCLTVMLDRSKIGDLKMPNIRTRQDYAFWLKITRKGFLAYGIPEVLAKYRLVENSISRNKFKAAKQNWYVYRHIEKHPLWKTLWYFSHYTFRSIRDVLKYRFIQ